jgi:hypothetical protein
VPNEANCQTFARECQEPPSSTLRVFQAPSNLAGFSPSGSNATVPEFIPTSGTGLAEQGVKQRTAPEARIEDVTKRPQPVMSARPWTWFTFARCTAALAALTVLLSTAVSPAGEVPIIFLGAIGVGQAKPEVRGQMRSLLREELSSADFAHLKTRERYTLLATLLRLDTVQSHDAVRATCVVSVALLRDNGSTLFALIHGRATAEEEKMHSDIAQSDALRAAVHSAMIRVPKALR